MNNAPSLTSITLLGRLRDDSDNEAAWTAFVEQYAPRILQWCRRWNLQQADAEDITQAVLIKLAGVMKDFQYDPTLTFRGWLHTVTRRTVTDFFRQRSGKTVASGGIAAEEQIESVEAKQDLIERLRETFDLELADAAMQLVRARVTPQRWQAYELTAIKQQSAAEVSQQLGMRVATVYTAKIKIQRMLREEIERLQSTPASSVLHRAEL